MNEQIKVPVELVTDLMETVDSLEGGLNDIRIRLMEAVETCQCGAKKEMGKLIPISPKPELDSLPSS